MKIGHLSRIGLIAFVAMITVVIPGCASKKPVAKNYLIFPPPPDEPRIQYLMSYGAEMDLGGGGRFKEFVVGQEKIHRPIWKPYGVAIRNGKIYVCDTQAANVSVTDLTKRKMRYIKPEGLAAMKTPINVAVDADETIYVTDTGRAQVLIYDRQDQLVEALGKKDEMKPCGVALSGDRFYVTDLKNHCVRVYNKTNRELLFTFPKDTKDENSRLYQPTNIAIDKKGRVCVSDTGGFCVKVFDLEGNHQRTIGDLGVTPGQFTLPKGIAVDQEGRIYVVDAAAAVIQLFDAEGKLLMYFGDSRSSGEAGLYLPAGILVDYENTSYFNKYLAPGHKLDYVILAINQAGPHKVSAFGFLKK
ncbi:MAG TPA: 6-bladed beta-propeller [Clostridia bacterium]|nr:6-bladed beta-propeller [Clostridia bacterium]